MTKTTSFERQSGQSRLLADSKSLESSDVAGNCEARPEQSTTKENHFRVRVSRDKLEPGPSHWFWSAKVPNDRKITDCCFGGLISWTNLKQWLKWYYERKVLAVPVYDSRRYSPDISTCCKAFELVHKLYKEPWAKVKDVLETFSEAVNVAHPFHQLIEE